jgi:DHA3 family macrolide efflux protein-like MFS transporter
MGYLPEGEFFWILPVIFLVGFMIPIVDGPISAVLQAKIDNEYQGRVTTLFGSIINLSGPIGLAAAGPLSDAFGLQIWFITAGILIFAMMLLGLFNKHLMNIDKGPEANGLGST